MITRAPLTLTSEGVVSTGIGSWPGTEMADALKITFAECPDLPYLPELPDRGPWAGLIGRGTALLSGLGIDLQSAGWRLTDTSSRDHRRALATLRSDLDQLEEIAQGYEGPVKIAVAGPWTLAASLEHPRGDKVLPDTGARREVGQSLEQGIVDLVAELTRRLPAITTIVQLDEPSLPAVLGGGIATASGLGRHRPVDIPEVSTAYTRLVERLGDAPVVVHCCAPGTPIELLANAGVTGLALDLALLGTPDWDALGVALEQGHWLLAGALPTTDPGAAPSTADQVASAVLGPIRRLELPPEISTHTVVTPACGLAGFSRTAAITALRTIRTAADIVGEGLYD
jgi:methionine synthase II (cobalamin-independent)